MKVWDKLLGRKVQPDKPAEVALPRPAEPDFAYIYLPGALIVGRYEVAGRPLMGGMGIVYICLDRAENRPVALKTFRPEYLADRAARDRFLRESTSWVDLGYHPHIVQAYRVVRVGDGREVYLVLELIAKEKERRDASLRSWLLPEKPLPIEQALLFALQIARGMAHAVARFPGFVHRDLKPENVLVGADHLPNAPVNRVRVTDFGLAAILEEGGVAHRGSDVSGVPLDQDGSLRRTQLTDRFLGTPFYMAPEQWSGRVAGIATDVYALGCILYEMLTGRPAVWGSTLSALRQAHCRGEIAPLPADLPPMVRKVCTRFLATDPQGRCASWREVEIALAATYAAVSGRTAPPLAPVGPAEEADSIAAGWSYSAMGLSYLDIGKTEVALDYFIRAWEVATKEHDRELECVGLNNMGLACATLGEVQRAIGYYDQALEIARAIGDRQQEGNALGNLGNAYGEVGEVQRAIGCFERALVLHHENGDPNGEASDWANLAQAWAVQDEFQRAIDYYGRALDIARAINDGQIEAHVLNNLGIVYKNMGELQQAIGYYQQSLAIARAIAYPQGQGNALGNLGLACDILGDAPQAIGYYEQALAIAHEIGDAMGAAVRLYNMARLYAEQGDRGRALQLARQAAEICEHTGSPYISQMRRFIKSLSRPGR